VSALASEKISEIEGQIASEIAADVTQRYLVWKDRSGALGFGDVNYPRADSFSIATRGKWYRVEREMPEIRRTAGMDTESGTTRKSHEMIAASLWNQAMVWKDENGNIGFGNVAYPNTDKLSISTGSKWYHMQTRSATEPSASYGTELETSYAPPEPERVAAKLRGQYLVWKDEQGAVGFSDVAYPSKDGLNVRTDAGWETRTIEKSRPTQSAVFGEQKKSMDSIANSLSGNYLVWKDENGVIGIGTVEYPGPKSITHIRRKEGWEKVVN
jgi:hypothetical protein